MMTGLQEAAIPQNEWRKDEADKQVKAAAAA